MKIKYVTKTIKNVFSKIKNAFTSPPQEGEDTYVFEVRKNEVIFLIETIKEKFGGEYPEDDNADPRSIFSMLKAAEKSITENEVNA